MKKLSIIFFSGYGHTETIADKILEGAKSVSGIDAAVIKINPEGTITDDEYARLHQSDAIIFGSPTYMGSAAAPFKKWSESTSKFFVEKKWKDKIAAGFSVSASLSGDKLNTLVQMVILAAQHGMLWAGMVENTTGNSIEDLNRIGSYLGLMAQADNVPPEQSPPESDRKTAVAFGIRIAELLKK